MPKKKGKAPISPPWALIKALAAVAARYGKLAANRQETNVSTLWASQAIDVVDVIVNHYIGQTADDLSWADVVDKVLGILDEWPETVDGWRQYAQRAIALGGVVAVAYRPLIYGALREFGRGNFASLADLRGATAKIEPSETMLRETVEFIRAMGVEKWAAAVKYLVDAEAEADVVNDGGAVAHSIDFRSVNWHGTKYTFTANQAACVKIWFEHLGRGAPDVSDEAVQETAEVSSRLRALFGSHAAWGTMIVEGATKGTHRLATPPKKTA